MFTNLEEKQILKLNDHLSHGLTISRIDSKQPQNEAFKEFCYNLNKLVPKIKVTKDIDSPELPPQIVVGKRLRYQAIPSGHEMQPFLEALTFLNSTSQTRIEIFKSRLNKKKLPVSLTLYIAPHCTFCPSAVRQLAPLPLVDDEIQLTIVDGTLFPEQAQEHRIQTVPTLLLDEQFRWTGTLPFEEVIDTINSRDPVSLGAASLENILKNGQAGHLAAMMLDTGQIFPAFYELVVHSKWPVRLGAMVVIEEIAGQNPAMASGLIDFLWNRFHHLPDQIRGDILYLFGEIRDDRAKAWLDEVLAGEFEEEVKEAAREALEKF